MAIFGIISDPNDLHSLAIASRLKELGHEPVFIDSTGSGKFRYLKGTWSYDGNNLDDIRVFFFRNMLSPLPPVSFEKKEYKLYRDWFTEYMHAREIFGVQLSWLFALEAQGKIIVNPPNAAGIGVLKPHQLFLLEKAGFPLPKTLIANDPSDVKKFVSIHKKVIFKPAMGGAYAELLDEKNFDRLETIRNQYVIFQEFIEGSDIRVTATEDEILAAAELDGNAVDFRATPGYEEMKTTVSPCEIPDQIAQLCLQGLKLLGLRYSGIDLKRTASGKYVFLEFNAHPAFLWIEKKIGISISGGISKFLVKLHESSGGAP